MQDFLVEVAPADALLARQAQLAFQRGSPRRRGGDRLERGVPLPVEVPEQQLVVVRAGADVVAVVPPPA